LYRKTAFSIILLLIPAVLIGQIIIDPPLEGNQAINFPDTPVGEESIIMINVTNNGNMQCQLMLDPPQAPFFIDNRNLIVAPGGIGAVTLTFAPQQAGDFRRQLSGMLALGINLQRIGPVTLNGTGIEEDFQPEITIDPEVIRLEINEDNGLVEEVLMIGNIGDEALVGEIEVPDLVWLAVEPDEFRIGEGDELDITLTFGDNWPENGDHETAITINSNDPENEVVEIPILLSLEIPRFVDRVIALREGWSMISSNVDFSPDFVDDEGPDMQLILNDIVEQVLIIKDEDGQFCAPPFNFWGLRLWDTSRGYLIKLEEETELNIVGIPIPFNRRIELEMGWNMIAFYPDYAVTFGNAIAELVERDQLIMLKNGRGEFYIPEFQFGFDYFIRSGEGVMAKVTEDCAFEYPPEPE